jgi:hypothetical protein
LEFVDKTPMLGSFESVHKTPKALANFSPGLVHRDNPGSANNKSGETLKGVGMCAVNPFRVELIRWGVTQGCRYAPTLG